MTIAPKYALQVGSKLVLPEKELVCFEKTQDGYTFLNAADGKSFAISFMDLARYLNMPSARMQKRREFAARTIDEFEKINCVDAAQLDPEEQENADFRRVCGQVVSEMRRNHEARPAKGKRKFSHNYLNRPDVQHVVAAMVEARFPGQVAIGGVRGGSAKKIHVLPKGRTLVRYADIADLEDVEDNVNGGLPFAYLNHLKGNRTSRICYEIRELMSEAGLKTLDPRKPAWANGLKYIKDKLVERNKLLRANGVEEIPVPSLDTYRSHIYRCAGRIGVSLMREGKWTARNKHAPGATDIRALKVGEYCMMDEHKISLLIQVKKAGYWHTLSDDYKAALEEIDEIIITRLHLLILLDIASRMPLAWVITDQPSEDATIELLRMATRDKRAEAEAYQCEGDPMPAVGLGKVVNDNGGGIRTAQIKAALLGVSAVSADARAYHSTDKMYVERFFGRAQTDVIELLHGYVGQRAGHLTGYDAKRNARLVMKVLHRILSRYLIDVYPSERHYGFGMDGGRPTEVVREINDDYGVIPPIDPHTRRIHLGIHETATPSDEGVKVLGLTYQCEELWSYLNGPGGGFRHQGPVDVYLDPDAPQEVTIIVRKHYDAPYTGHMAHSVFADCNLTQILQILQRHRQENPQQTELYEDRIARTRRSFDDEMHALGLQKMGKRSFATYAEIRSWARDLATGARVVPPPPAERVTAPGAITQIGAGANAYIISDEVITPDAPCNSAAPSQASFPEKAAGRFFARPETKGKLT